VLCPQCRFENREGIRLSRRTGKREEAREHLTTATSMYREMDMRFWLEQAERELKGA
jgi:hypothetical protein